MAVRSRSLVGRGSASSRLTQSETGGAYQVPEGKDEYESRLEPTVLVMIVTFQLQNDTGTALGSTVATPVRMSSADRGEDVGHGHALLQATVCPGSQGPLDLAIAELGRHHENQGSGKFGADGYDGLYPRHARQVKVHQGHVGLIPAERFDGIFGAGDFGDQHQLRVARHDGRQTAPDDRVIVHAH